MRFRGLKRPPNSFIQVSSLYFQGLPAPPSCRDLVRYTYELIQVLLMSQHCLAPFFRSKHHNLMRLRALERYMKVCGMQFAAVLLFLWWCSDKQWLMFWQIRGVTEVCWNLLEWIESLQWMLGISSICRRPSAPSMKCWCVSFQVNELPLLQWL